MHPIFLSLIVYTICLKVYLCIAGAYIQAARTARPPPSLHLAPVFNSFFQQEDMRSALYEYFPIIKTIIIFDFCYNSIHYCHVI